MQKALNLTRKKHADHWRLDGSPYMVHLVEVAYYMILLDFDDDVSLAAALTHDGPEDGKMTFEDIIEEVNEVVSKIVRLLTKPSGISLEEFERYLAGIFGEIRALVIKFIDRFANMKRSFIGYFNEEKLRKYVGETTLMVDMLEDFITGIETDGSECQKQYGPYAKRMRILRGFLKGMLDSTQAHLNRIDRDNEGVAILEEKMDILLEELS